MTLVYTATLKPVKKGDEATTFRGERVAVVDIQKPHKPESTGRVYVKDQHGRQLAFYPGVIGAHWEGR